MTNEFAFYHDREVLEEEIRHYPMEYQEKLSMPTQQYGIEIEFEHANLQKLASEFHQMHQVLELVTDEHWCIATEECTKKVQNNCWLGGEVTSPIFRNTKENWQQLENVCRLIQEYGGYSSDACSIHVHIDLDVLGHDKEKWTKFLSLWAIYENVIIDFATGEKEKIRPRWQFYAFPIRKFVQNSLIEGTAIWDYPDLYSEKKNAVNTKYLESYLSGGNREHNTIEFRIANGTLNPLIIQNLVRCYQGLLNAVKYENHVLDYYLDMHQDILYDVADLDDQVSEFDMACELVDIIFENDTDKYYFLKQYTKNLPIYTKSEKEKRKTL